MTSLFKIYGDVSVNVLVRGSKELEWLNKLLQHVKHSAMTSFIQNIWGYECECVGKRVQGAGMA